jgi:hypothetical protein
MEKYKNIVIFKFEYLGCQIQNYIFKLSVTPPASVAILAAQTFLYESNCLRQFKPMLCVQTVTKRTHASQN